MSHLTRPLRPTRPLLRDLLIGCLIVAFIAGCNTNSIKATELQSALADSARYTTVEWLDSTKDFGKIPEGQKLPVIFRFKNTGTTPLVITRVQPSCGCTVAEQPEAPIAPGGEGQIRAIFNSQGHAGVNHKTLFVTANTKGSQNHALQFVVEVEKKAS
jgi:hypothetical protein